MKAKRNADHYSDNDVDKIAELIDEIYKGEWKWSITQWRNVEVNNRPKPAKEHIIDKDFIN